VKTFEQRVLSVEANQNLSLYSNPHGFHLGASPNRHRFLRQAAAASQGERRTAWVLAGRARMS